MHCNQQCNCNQQEETCECKYNSDLNKIHYEKSINKKLFLLIKIIYSIFVCASFTLLVQQHGSNMKSMVSAIYQIKDSDLSKAITNKVPFQLVYCLRGRLPKQQQTERQLTRFWNGVKMYTINNRKQGSARVNNILYIFYFLLFAVTQTFINVSQLRKSSFSLKKRNAALEVKSNNSF